MIGAPAPAGVSPELLGELAHRAARADFPRLEAQLRSSGYCARPVRLRGEVRVCEGQGRPRTVWSTDSEPDGILRKACGNRREAVCPPCAERYRGDAYQLIAAGLRGGKDVPETVTGHPAVFVTFTAPSFGIVHTRPLDRAGEPRRCRPRRDAPVCEHGVRLSCAQVHDEDDPCLGEPICPDCFQYGDAVIWNNVLGELWRRTVPVYLPRVLAREVEVTQAHLRELVRVAYMRVAEYQRRGLVHLHAVIRLDRAMPDYRGDQLRPPDARFTPRLLEDAVHATVAEVSAPVPDELGGGRVRWGEQLDIRHLDPAARREVAGYLAKYATKSTEQAGGLLHPITAEDVDTAPVREHVRRYLHHAFRLDATARAAVDDHEAERRSPVGPAAETAHDPNLLARRVQQAMSTDGRVSVRLRDRGGEHVGRITSFAPAAAPPRLTLDSGDTIAVADIAAIATSTYTAKRPRHKTPDRRLGACAHAFGYRGQCLSKSRRYSTTFKALRQAREQHVQDRLAASDDASQRALAEVAASERVASFTYAGRGHLTTADAFLAASAAARAREERRIAREERCWPRAQGPGADGGGWSGPAAVPAALKSTSRTEAVQGE
jgi:hypothetical protein